jgi:hypothetical protein
LSEIVAVLGPPSNEDLVEMSCSESTISELFSAARIRESLSEALVQKMGPFVSNKSPKILQLLPELLTYNPNKRLKPNDAIAFIRELI